MFLECIKIIFSGCGHKNITRPFTIKGETYKVCLDCGAEIYYSLEHYRFLTKKEIAEKEKSELAVLEEANA